MVGIRSGRMTAEEGRKATEFWDAGWKPAPGSGRDPKEIAKRRADTIKKYTVAPRPLDSLSRIPQYEGYFAGQEGVLRAASVDEKLTPTQLMKKYGGFKAAGDARARARAVRGIERKLAAGEAEAKWQGEQVKDWDPVGQPLQAGVGLIPMPDKWKQNARTMAAGAVPSLVQLGVAVGKDFTVNPVKAILSGGKTGVESEMVGLAGEVGKQYAGTYGKGVEANPLTWHHIASNWQENYKENPLFALFDLAALASPVSRALGVGKLSVTRVPHPTGDGQR